MARSQIPNIDNLSLAELNELIERANALLEGKREEAKREFMARMRADAAAMGISLDELLGRTNGRRKRSDAGMKLQPKYIGPNGETYTGRGPTPGWLKALEAKGQKREKFLVK
jgi:DNA-binding protein H-NS